MRKKVSVGFILYAALGSQIFSASMSPQNFNKGLLKSKESEYFGRKNITKSIFR